MDIQKLTSELVPENGNLIGGKKKKRTSNGKVNQGISAKRTEFTSVDPFKNCNEFVQYYRGVVRTVNDQARFATFDVDRKMATQIMDLLMENNKNDDKAFLQSWIRYYATSYLNGKNIYKPEITALSSFKDTFTSYAGKYFSG